MEAKQLQENLEKAVDDYMERTRYLDVVYALLFAGVVGAYGGFLAGARCTERFLSRCVAYVTLPTMFTAGFLLVGIPAFWMFYKTFRGRRRRKKWFG